MPDPPQPWDDKEYNQLTLIRMPLVTANRVLVTPKVIMVYPTHDIPNTQLVYAWKTSMEENIKHLHHFEYSMYLVI